MASSRQQSTDSTNTGATAVIRGPASRSPFTTSLERYANTTRQDRSPSPDWCAASTDSVPACSDSDSAAAAELSALALHVPVKPGALSTLQKSRSAEAVRIFPVSCQPSAPDAASSNCQPSVSAVAPPACQLPAPLLLNRPKLPNAASSPFRRRPLPGSWADVARAPPQPYKHNTSPSPVPRPGLLDNLPAPRFATASYAAAPGPSRYVPPQARAAAFVVHNKRKNKGKYTTIPWESLKPFVNAHPSGTRFVIRATSGGYLEPGIEMV